MVPWYIAFPTNRHLLLNGVDMSRLSWTILLVLSMAGIAATYPILKYLNGAVDPYLLAFLRFFVASLALAPIMAYRHSLRPPPKSDLPLFLVLAFSVTIPTVFIVIGVEHTNTIVSAVLIPFSYRNIYRLDACRPGTYQRGNLCRPARGFAPRHIALISVFRKRRNQFI